MAVTLVDLEAVPTEDGATAALGVGPAGRLFSVEGGIGSTEGVVRFRVPTDSFPGVMALKIQLMRDWLVDGVASSVNRGKCRIKVSFAIPNSRVHK